jgi:hypothetical protein
MPRRSIDHKILIIHRQDKTVLYLTHSIPQKILQHLSSRFHFSGYRKNIHCFTQQGRQPCAQTPCIIKCVQNTMLNVKLCLCLTN